MTETKYKNLGIWDVQKRSVFWKILSKEINANLKIITTVSRDLNRLELKTKYEKVKITFSESDTKPLFVHCEFDQIRNLTWFEISKSDFIEKIIHDFSRNTIQSNHKKFNKTYLSKTIENDKVKSIINNKIITDLILKLNLSFIGGSIGNNENFILSLNIHREIQTLQQLGDVYKLTTKLIEVINGKELE